MITFQTEIIETNDSEYSKDREYAIINGIEDEKSFIIRSREIIMCTFYNEIVISILINEPFNEIGKHFSEFSYSIQPDWWEDNFSISIYCNKYHNNHIPSIEIDLQFQNWEDWNKPWSMANYAKIFEETILDFSDNNIIYWQSDNDSPLNGFGICYNFSSGDDIIQGKVELVIEILHKIVEQTNLKLIAEVNKDIVFSYFDFPNEIKAACKQYLIYFTQFLADIGIDADAEFREEMNKTMFRIIPKDKDESLQYIRDALDVYLHTPNNPDFQLLVNNQADIAAKQWEANVYHLKSQLLLSQSLIKARDIELEALELTNSLYKQQLQTVISTTKKHVNEVDLIDGIVSIGKYEGKGYSINFAELFNRLRRRFK